MVSSYFWKSSPLTSARSVGQGSQNARLFWTGCCPSMFTDAPSRYDPTRSSQPGGIFGGANNTFQQQQQPLARAPRARVMDGFLDRVAQAEGRDQLRNAMPQHAESIDEGINLSNWTKRSKSLSVEWSWCGDVCARDRDVPPSVLALHTLPWSHARFDRQVNQFMPVLFSDDFTFAEMWSMDSSAQSRRTAWMFRIPRSSMLFLSSRVSPCFMCDFVRFRSDPSASAVLDAHDRYCWGLGRVLVFMIHTS